MKYKKENGVRVYYTNDLLYKIVPTVNDFRIYRLIEGKYKFITGTLLLFDAKQVVAEMSPGSK
ncbi:hypothetical protein CS063_01635 [Sporanaerobium hydrogeniformans]|uniref:Uncharacterized protein n=1 Tax=Sporanaerobium hydrogeniformans TaxID=3072179 RepID=A0AC61DIY0_9FIRM|nr:hypothetical protein [Sporanaerobium hydrogeniformans]PHV72202.1 hypothetical protein CS063_01635 [Sporanaerobium hydrogeniformans]